MASVPHANEPQKPILSSQGPKLHTGSQTSRDPAYPWYNRLLKSTSGSSVSTSRKKKNIAVRNHKNANRPELLTLLTVHGKPHKGTRKAYPRNQFWATLDHSGLLFWVTWDSRYQEILGPPAWMMRSPAGIFFSRKAPRMTLRSSWSSLLNVEPTQQP